MTVAPAPLDQFSIDVFQHGLNAGESFVACADVALEAFEDSLRGHRLLLAAREDLLHPHFCARHLVLLSSPASKGLGTIFAP